MADYSRSNQYLSKNGKKVPSYAQTDPDMVKTFGMPVKGPRNYEYQFENSTTVWGTKVKPAGGGN